MCHNDVVARAQQERDGLLLKALVQVPTFSVKPLHPQSTAALEDTLCSEMSQARLQIACSGFQLRDKKTEDEKVQRLP